MIFTWEKNKLLPCAFFFPHKEKNIGKCEHVGAAHKNAVYYPSFSTVFFLNTWEGNKNPYHLNFAVYHIIHFSNKI